MSALSERLLGLVQRLFEKSANVGLGSGRMGRAWRKAFFLFGQSRVLTRTRFHGASVVVPAGHPYQVFLNRYPTYNTPILVAIDLAWRGLPLTYCDVGAGVGDTMILARSTNRIGVTIGIDGDESFLKLARRNLDSVASCELICSMLTGRDGDEIRGLEPVHAGTRTAIGDWASEGVSLDTVLAGRSVDILKVDVDGYDGQVLQGAGDTLGRYSPIVVFEYHPALIDGVGQTRSLPWDALGLAGYDRAIAFDKFGLLMAESSLADCAAIVEAAISHQPVWADAHADIIAYSTSFLSRDTCLEVLSRSSSAQSSYVLDEAGPGDVR